MSRVFISAAHKSSGKTTVSIGLCAALHACGYKIQSFKKGPDYIDPLWLTQATERPCFNLDFNTQSHEEISQLWQTASANADLGFIEGNKGLYDGVDPQGSDCNAALARYLNVPVILVIDTQGITRGIAPLIMGYQHFDSSINIIGVILNKIAGRRHEAKLRQAVEMYTDLPVLGAIYRHADLQIDERHLGLVPSNEHDFSAKKIGVIREHIERQVDLDQLINLIGLKKQADEQTSSGAVETTVRIGIAQDSAFGFYYQDDLAEFAQHGAELVPVDLIHDETLPDIDGLFIGGGFPETHMQELAKNTSMKSAVYNAVTNNLPVYAECGGLMYLCRGIEWNGRKTEMSGAIPADVCMHRRPQGRGYIRLEPTGGAPWQPVSIGQQVFAHEFHHSSLENVPEDLTYAYSVKRGHGIDGKRDGIVFRNTIAGYAHLRSTQGSPWIKQFVEFVKQQKEDRNDN